MWRHMHEILSCHKGCWWQLLWKPWLHQWCSSWSMWSSFLPLIIFFNNISYHKEHLPVMQAIPVFQCKNCKYKKHQCFACGRLGSSDVSCGAEVLISINLWKPATCLDSWSVAWQLHGFSLPCGGFIVSLLIWTMLLHGLRSSHVSWGPVAISITWNV